ncbi:NAD-dependent SIR2 family protein deacetylase [Bradyrhizobium diazoefficiens]
MKPALKNFITDYLAELVLGNAAIFAGAGLSVPAGYVDWRELLRPLAKDLELNIDLENDLVAFAQFHVNARAQNRHKLHEALLEALSRDTEPTHNHRLLAQLPITTFWTTNYDKLIENTLHDHGKVVDVKSSVPQMATTRPNRDVTIFKMHGDIDRPDEAVVTKDDYERYAREREPFITALAGDLVKRTFLFLGFSFTDPNLEHVLSQVRLNFTTNQRQHYAIFRSRKKVSGETDDHFAHQLARQVHVIEDLKRFNVRVLLIDEYSEITDVLTELVNRYRRRTVFISTSAFNFDPWGQPAVIEFAQELGRKLVADGTRVATGLGAGVGDAIFTGVLREVMQTRGMSIEDALVLRPFPHSGDPSQLPSLWEQYRQEIISQAGIALFLFGNKEQGSVSVNADGLVREFDIARAQPIPVLPIGATGSAAKALADLAVNQPDNFTPELDADGRVRLAALANHTDDLKSLIHPIIELIRKLQGKG